MGIIGTAKPANATSGQTLPDAIASTVPTNASTIAIDHTSASGQAGRPAAFFVLHMPASVATGVMRLTRRTRHAQPPPVALEALRAPLNAATPSERI